MLSFLHKTSLSLDHHRDHFSLGFSFVFVVFISGGGGRENLRLVLSNRASFSSGLRDHCRMRFRPPNERAGNGLITLHLHN